MVWPCFKVFWFSKDNPTGHSERKKKKSQTEEEVGIQYQLVDRNGLCQLKTGLLKTGQEGKRLLRIKILKDAFKIREHIQKTPLKDTVLQHFPW